MMTHDATGRRKDAGSTYFRSPRKIDPAVSNMKPQIRAIPPPWKTIVYRSAALAPHFEHFLIRPPRTALR